MRKIGLDVGDKTVGIAVSDELGYTAQGVMTLERVGIRKDTGKILDMVKEYNCDTIVIGLNKKLDGSDSIQTEKVQEFRTMLENKMRSRRPVKTVVFPVPAFACTNALCIGFTASCCVAVRLECFLPDKDIFIPLLYC